MFTKTSIEQYFLAEKSGAFVLMILGLVAMVLACIFFFGIKTNWYKGAAIALFIVGTWQAAIGFSTRQHADTQRKQVTYAYDMDPGFLRSKEMPRMQKVERRLKIAFYIEIVLLLAGVSLYFYWKQDAAKALWLGLFCLLAIEISISLAADRIAAARTKKYMEGLEKFLAPKATMGISGGNQ